jgi:hypothetical protein
MLPALSDCTPSSCVGYNSDDVVDLRNIFEVISMRITMQGFIVSDFPENFPKAAEAIKKAIEEGKYITDGGEHKVPSSFEEVPKTWQLLFSVRSFLLSPVSVVLTFDTTCREGTRASLSLSSSERNHNSSPQLHKGIVCRSPHSRWVSQELQGRSAWTLQPPRLCALTLLLSLSFSHHHARSCSRGNEGSSLLDR